MSRATLTSGTASLLRLHRSLIIVVLVSLAVGCAPKDGSDGAPGLPGPPGASAVGPGAPTDSGLTRDDDLPGITVTVTEVKGASGVGGTFQVGDFVTFHFTVKKDDGSDWNLDELSGRALVSGPTVNYQRVLVERTDVAATAAPVAAGVHSYTFPTAIPGSYLAPLNDTATFGAGDGEWAGTSLISGTYTLGLYFVWSFTFEEAGKRDAGSAVANFLLGTATTITPREVIGQENCNACHEDLRIHGDMRRDVRICVLCHTSGAEDKNVATAAGGTPDITIDFRVMIHKIHNGSHLPSVLGVTTMPGGDREYAATPKPYQIVGFGNSVHDFSEVAFPVWPNAALPMPRDTGYAAASATIRGLEDQVRTGVTDCEKCHGDPDGAGPFAAPAQGILAYSQPTRRACGACHDDVDFDGLYTSNGQTMPEQATDSACVLCHEISGTHLDVVDAHRHPLFDPLVNAGLHIDVTTVAEAGTNDGDGTLDPGEKISVTFGMIDDLGNSVDANQLGSFFSVVSGPTTNQNLVLYEAFPLAALPGSPPYTTFLPERIQFERVGVSTALDSNESFTSIRFPHWSVQGAATDVWVRGASIPPAPLPNLTAAAPALQNYIDVSDGGVFARNDFIVIADGTGSEEYRKIQTVEVNRLWFSSPYTANYPTALTLAHAAGETVTPVSITLVDPAGYNLDAPSGTIDEMTEFGDGEVLVSYTTDFVVPAKFGPTLNDTPTMDESWGKWAGKSLASGTYTVTLWGYRNLSVPLFGETTTYRGTSPGAAKQFLVGAATTIEPYDLISSGENCTTCHEDVFFHGGSRRGFTTCIACHGNLGAEDRAPYVAPGAPVTEVTVSFRTMLHKIHMGAELVNASNYVVNGFGSTPYPNNFTEHTYDHIEFPALPGGVRECAKCHGVGNTAWMEPSERAHPTESVIPIRAWRAVCGACHDSNAAQAHIDGQTAPSGAEACAVCHGTDREWAVERMHRSE